MGRARDEALAPLRLTPDEESQYRCAGFVEAQTERLATFEAQAVDEGNEDVAERQPGQSSLPRGAVYCDSEPEPLLTGASPTDMGLEHSVRAVLGTFAAALVTQTFSIRHAAVLLPFFGRGNAFVDELCRKLVEKLKDEGLFNDQGTATLVMVLTKALTAVRFVIADQLAVADSLAGFEPSHQHYAARINIPRGAGQAVRICNHGL